jgi:adenylylsulfate kinase
MTTWVMLAGLPGTGKSTLARALAARLRGAVLSKDLVREALFPGPMTDYTREQDDLCVRAMLEAAEYLTRGRRVEFIFLDGRTFSRREQIEQVVHAAGEAGAAWRILHVVCADAVAEARLAACDPLNPAANRNPELYREIKARFEAIRQPHLVLDTTDGANAVLDQAVRVLQPRGDEGRQVESGVSLEGYSSTARIDPPA